MLSQITQSIYRIKIQLKGNPLGNLNCYVVRSDERNLLIDTGFNQPPCYAELMDGIHELGIDMTRTDILVTHSHSDHFGLVDKMLKPGCRAYVGEFDKAILESPAIELRWEDSKRSYVQEGFPPDDIDQAVAENPARAFATEKPVVWTGLKDGQILEVGDTKLTVIHTPGHSPGHICMYSERDGAMFLGDHVLFDITPNLTPWPNMPNPLKEYLHNLKLIQSYDVILPLPGHRDAHGSLTQRVDELIAHHEARLDEALQIVVGHPEINAYDLAGKMTWSYRKNKWEDFPQAQKWFAMGEAIAHLNCLMDRGEIRKEFNGKVYAYVRN